MGYDITLWFNDLGDGSLGAILKSFSFLGSEVFYILLFSLIFWCIDKSIGKRVFTITLLTVYLSTLLKYIWMRPRPDGLIMNRLGPTDEYGFPSAHIMGVVALWGYLFTISKKYRVRFLCFLVILFTAISRLVHGVNFVEDVLTGIVLSFLTLTLFKVFEPKVTTTCNQRYTVFQRLLLICFSTGAAIVVTILLGLDNIAQSVAIIGTFFGGMTGIVLEKEYLGFSVDGSLIIRIGRYVLGLTLISLLFYGSQVLFNSLGLDSLFLNFIRYGLLAFIATYPIPKLFVLTNLSEIKKYNHL